MPTKKHLIDSPEFESRSIHWLACLDPNGKFIGFESLTGVDPFKPIPRTLEPKDSGETAEFLMEDFETAFGLGSSPAEKRTAKGWNKHLNFWSRIEQASRETGVPELKAVLAFKANWPAEHLPPGIAFQNYQAPKTRQGKEQWMVATARGDFVPVRQRPQAPADVSFRVGDKILIQIPAVLDWWCGWFAQWLTGKRQKCLQVHGGPGICLVSGITDAAISDSHLPKIYGVPNTGNFGGTLVSSESDSFHSYGLSGPENDASYSSVSVEAAIAYGNALNFLLEHEDHHFVTRPFAFCFWAKHTSLGFVTRLLTKPQPKEVRKFLASPFSGKPREDLKKERFHSVTLTGNAGRVVVWHWLTESLEDAGTHLDRWFRELEIAAIPHTTSEEPPYPSIEDLCRATVRDPKDSNNPKEANPQIADLPAQLYRAAVEGTPVSIVLIKRVLRRLAADIVKYGDSILETHLLKDKEAILVPQLHPATQKQFRDANQLVPPSGQARMALLKLILNRNRKETDMAIESKLADTDDVAYNCGRLLAVFDALQWRAHDGKLEGPGVVERYFGTASASPNSAFNILWRLHVHHLKKLSRQGDKGAAAAYAVESRITEISARFGQTEAMRQKRQPPSFPRVLDLQGQGRFALGFYQQKAADADAIANAIANKPKPDVSKS